MEVSVINEIDNIIYIDKQSVDAHGFLLFVVPL